MTNEEINEKYGIEPIMKEMWVWDNDPKYAFLMLVVYKRPECNLPYTCIKNNGGPYTFKNASETNPNNKEPKVGDMGYFWDDDEDFYAYGLLEGINKRDVLPYLCGGLSWNAHFSHEKQPWMK